MNLKKRRQKWFVFIVVIMASVFFTAWVVYARSNRGYHGYVSIPAYCAIIDKEEVWEDGEWHYYLTIDQSILGKTHTFQLEIDGSQETQYRIYNAVFPGEEYMGVQYSYTVPHDIAKENELIAEDGLFDVDKFLTNIALVEKYMKVDVVQAV